MAEQDRGRWDREAIERGVALISAALPRGPSRSAWSPARAPA